MVRTRARIRFRKQGDLRLIGHRDLVRLLERLFRRAGVGLAMSQGFHPKPRMSFPSALALGIEGLDEVMEVELVEPASGVFGANQPWTADPFNAEALRSELARHSVPGLTFASVEILPAGAKKAQLRSSTYQLPLPDDSRAAVAERIVALGLAPRKTTVESMAAAEGCDCATPEAMRQQVALVRRSLEAIGIEGGMLWFRLRSSRERSAGPRDVLTVLGLDDVERRGVYLTRAQVQLESCESSSQNEAPVSANACSPTLPG
jgi:hypothetical protein